MSRTPAVFVILLSAATTAFPQVTVSSCGDVVPPRGHAVVANDITCDPSTPAVVEVGDRGHLDLVGHTLGGGVSAVRCAGVCIVESTTRTGTIRDATAGISTVGKRVKVSNLDFENDNPGILADFTTALVRGTHVTITSPAQGPGAQAKTARFTDLTATGGSPAVQVQRAVLVGSLITGCSGSAIRGGLVRLVNTTHDRRRSTRHGCALQAAAQQLDLRAQPEPGESEPELGRLQRRLRATRTGPVQAPARARSARTPASIADCM